MKLTLGLVVGIGALLMLGLKRPADPVASNEEIKVERSASETAVDWQNRLFQQGVEAGRNQMERGGPMLDRGAVGFLAEKRFPQDRTAHLLWSMGFEQGQSARLLPR